MSSQEWFFLWIFKLIFFGICPIWAAYEIMCIIVKLGIKFNKWYNKPPSLKGIIK